MPHEVIGLGLPGMLVTLTGLVIFIGSVYVLVALNTGWRFGYWVTFAAFGGLMVFFSLFWLANPVGPRGDDPIWMPIAVGSDSVPETEFGGTTYEAPAAYPGGVWREASDEPGPRGAIGFGMDLVGRRKEFADPLRAEVDAFSSALSNCLGFDEQRVEETHHEIEDKIPGWERTVLEGKFHKRERLEREVEVCARAYSLLPTEDTLPQAGEEPVGVTYDVTNIRFTREDGTLLGQAVVVPNTYDPRHTGDASGTRAVQVGEPMTILAYRDPGAVRYPSWVYLGFWGAFFAFHLWGLAGAERRKLSPVAA